MKTDSDCIDEAARDDVAGAGRETNRSTARISPVVLLGHPRSGLLALGNALAVGGHFHGLEYQGGFAHVIARATDTVLAQGDANPNAVLSAGAAQKALTAGLAETIDSVWRARAQGRKDRRWIDRSPGLEATQAAPSIQKIVPDANFIFLYREPIETLRSQCTQWPSSRERLPQLAARWSKTMAAWRAARADLQDATCATIDYATLAGNPVGVIEELTSLLALSPERREEAGHALVANRLELKPHAEPIEFTADEIATIEEATAQEAANWSFAEHPPVIPLPAPEEAFTDAGGIPFTLRVPQPAARKSVFALSVHKAGSVLFDRVIIDMARAAGAPRIDVEPQTFRQGVLPSGWTPDVYALFDRPGYIFHGFRGIFDLPSCEGFRESRKVLLVRDPRDILTSYYFSMARSHAVPDAGASRVKVLAEREAANEVGIDAYVRTGAADFILKNMRTYVDLAAGPDVKVFRYEDIIFEKRRWCRELAEWMGLDLDPLTTDAIADRHDLRPVKEDPNAHVRQVAPGNYKKHLGADTVAMIEERYADVFRFFGYAGERQAQPDLASSTIR